MKGRIAHCVGLSFQQRDCSVAVALQTCKEGGSGSTPGGSIFSMFFGQNMGGSSGSARQAAVLGSVQGERKFKHSELKTQMATTMGLEIPIFPGVCEFRFPPQRKCSNPSARRCMRERISREGGGACGGFRGLPVCGRRCPLAPRPAMDLGRMLRDKSVGCMGEAWTLWRAGRCLG